MSASLGNAAFVLPNARFQSDLGCAGMLTPPDSPKYATSAESPAFSDNFSLGSSESLYSSHIPHSAKSELPYGHTDLSRVSETIYTIIEQVIEQKLAEAMGPLRLNIRRFDSENTDLQTQNNTLGFKVGQIEQQLETLQNISAAASTNLQLITSLAKQMHQINTTKESHAIFNAQYCPQDDSRSQTASPPHHFHDVQPQFRFERRSSKHQYKRSLPRKTSKWASNIFSKWRAGGSGSH